VAGLLLESPLLGPDDLVDESTLWAQDVTPVIVQQAIARLEPRAARVLQALALFGTPVSRAALEFLLSPTIEPTSLAPILNRLVRAFFIRFDKGTRQFTLHPIDQEYCYGQIPDDDAQFGRRQLHQRAAQFFRHQRLPQTEWLTVDDISAPLAEFEHLIQADEYPAAAEVLLLIDRDYLWEWGQYARLQAMHSRLQGHLTDPHLARTSRRRLAWTHWPDIPTVAPLFEDNLTDARRHGDRAGEADALDDLAQVRRFQADWRAAELHEQALSIYRDLGDRRGQGDALGGAAAAYFGLGQVERAIENNQRAIDIHRELNNQASLGFALWSLAGCLAFVGQFEQAIACHNTAIGVYKEINAPRGLALHLASRAFVNGRLGRYEPAFDDLREAAGIYHALQDREGIYRTQMGRGGVLIQKGKASEAIRMLEEVQASGIHNRITLAFATYFLVQALLAAGRLAEARALVAQTPTGPPSLQAISMAVMDGIIRARLEELERSRATFRKVLADAKPFLQRPGRFQFLYLCGLARAGLALTDGAEAWLDGALTDITTALNECAAPGLVSQHRQLLAALMACPGGELLDPIRQIMAAAAG
jgi:tetratricopeptide (TPR) repeat protein